jgi:hypothetical protein
MAKKMVEKEPKKPLFGCPKSGAASGVNGTKKGKKSPI